MKHRRGTRGAAPTSDAAGRGDVQETLLPALPAASRNIVPRGFHVLFADSRQREPTRLRFGSIRKESGRFLRNWADSGLNRSYQPKWPIQAEIQKKKKGAERIG